jgi:hypothetical protein
MTAILAWLDYSERDRKRALDVVGLLREPSTVDELGLGPVRDAFADMLFPGTSTIQTRARYFLFVPWQYAELERLRFRRTRRRRGGGGRSLSWSTRWPMPGSGRA